MLAYSEILNLWVISENTILGEWAERSHDVNTFGSWVSQSLKIVTWANNLIKMTKDSQETSWTFDQEETSQAAYKRDDVGGRSQFCFRSCEVKMQTPEASAML